MTAPENLLDVITAIMADPEHARTSNVRDWPADEAEAHRNFDGDFEERNTAVTNIRRKKVAAEILTAVTPLIRAKAWLDAADWLEDTVTTRSPSTRLEMWASNELRALAPWQLPETKHLPDEIREMMARRVLAGGAPETGDEIPCAILANPFKWDPPFGIIGAHIIDPKQGPGAIYDPLNFIGDSPVTTDD